jgi:hypothetical protein
MHGTLPGCARHSSVLREQTGKFGTIVLAVWPDDTAAHLARAIKSTKRHAAYIIRGERKVTARCIQAIINEILN